VIPGPEHVDDLVVFVRLDRLRQRDEVGLEPTQLLHEHRPPLVPGTAPAPQVLGDDTHL
jgi:hypothetical protein